MCAAVLASSVSTQPTASLHGRGVHGDYVDQIESERLRFGDIPLGVSYIMCVGCCTLMLQLAGIGRQSRQSADIIPEHMCTLAINKS